MRLQIPLQLGRNMIFSCEFRANHAIYKTIRLTHLLNPKAEIQIHFVVSKTYNMLKLVFFKCLHLIS
jgi:hypothetical protein